jgi:hypothetical protein
MSSRQMSRLPIALLFIALVFIGEGARGEPQAARRSEIDVILWFDTEDYISPSDDEADKRLAELLSERHVRATFKVVGEKARVLEKRGRTDVIEAMKKHDIGFHANFHSVHPAPAEYLADCGLLDGMAEFTRREGPGAADVRRVFGLPTLVCYGQPGSSWAPQAIAALPACGIAPHGVPCYVDSGNHIGFKGIPFWYCGALVVYDMHPNETRMDLFADGGLERGEKDIDEIADRLSRGGGGLISIFYHPCEWVTSEFWDAANFRRGANPPREQWKLPAQRPKEQSEQAFTRFAAYIDHIRSLPGVRFVTASELPGMYPDALRTQGATEADVRDLAAAILAPDFKGLDDVTLGGKVFSPADQFEVLTLATADLIDHPSPTLPPRAVPLESLLGPDSSPPQEPAEPREPIAWPAFRRSVLDARDYVRVNHRVPPRVFIGNDATSPGDFLIGLASAYAHHQQAGQFPDSVGLGRDVQVLTANHVVKDGPNVYGGWIIHRVYFRAPKILEVARLQAWTLKPALRGG